MHSDVRSDHAVGVILLVVAAVTYSTAGIFTKGVSADAWAIIFWRGLFAAAFTTGWTIQRGTFAANFLTMGVSGWGVATIGAIGTAAFIPAFKLTSIANVSLIYATAPLIAASLAWLLIGEKIARGTFIGSISALFGVGTIVSGSLGQLSLQGDGLALIMTAAMASIMVLYRVYPGTPGAGPAAMQSVLLLPPSFMLGAAAQTDPREILVLATFGLLFAIASVTLAEGAKRVPAGQTGLISALETPMAPVLAFLVLAEVPNVQTFWGGAIVLVAVFLSVRSNTGAA